ASARPPGRSCRRAPSTSASWPACGSGSATCAPSGLTGCRPCATPSTAAPTARMGRRSPGPSRATSSASCSAEPPPGEGLKAARRGADTQASGGVRPMLVLTRKLGEIIRVGESVTVRVLEVKGHQVRLGIEAPADVRIYREEVYRAIQKESEDGAP